ncbi:MAG: hypothetical protein AAGG07_12225 [Planctomycetota bacterium]
MRRPRLAFVCRASASVGMGHLMRSGAVAAAAMPHAETRLLVIGDRAAGTLRAASGVPGAVYSSDDAAIEAAISWDPGAVVLDMTELDESQVSKLTDCPVASLSPVFDRLDRCDLFFHRTIHHPLAHLAADRSGWRLGLDYAVVRRACARIPTERYLEAIAPGHRLPVAVCMGGGDAGNKTLRVLERLREIDRPMTFWVLLGEGYGHSHDELFDAARHGSRHEIILARTTESMWRVMRSCAVGVFAAGTVTYEAAAAGLPSINLFEERSHGYLVEELVERGVALDAAAPFDVALDRATDMLCTFDSVRDELLAMHRASEGLIDGRADERIVRGLLDATGVLRVPAPAKEVA